MTDAQIIEFRDSGGYTINGLWYPRVTKIVEIKSKPALYKFYAELKDFNEGERIKQQSASEGTLIHETIEALLLGETPAISPTIQGAVDAFHEFMEKNALVVDPAYVEHRIFHPTERYAGTLDAIACIDGIWGILDIKTSQSIYRDYNLQTAAYMAALISDLPQLQTRWILRIDQNQVCTQCGARMRSKGGREKIRLPWKNGERQKALACEHIWSSIRGEVELKECHDWNHDYEAFLGAKKLWEWEHESELKQLGYL